MQTVSPTRPSWIPTPLRYVLCLTVWGSFGVQSPGWGPGDSELLFSPSHPPFFLPSLLAETISCCSEQGPRERPAASYCAGNEDKWVPFLRGSWHPVGGRKGQCFERAGSADPLLKGSPAPFRCSVCQSQSLHFLRNH